MWISWKFNPRWRGKQSSCCILYVLLGRVSIQYNMWDTVQLFYFSITCTVSELCLSNHHYTPTIQKFSVASQQGRHLFHFDSKHHIFGISTDQGVGTALTPLKQFRIWHKKWLISSLIGATSRHFSSSRHLLQIKSGSAASCSSPCYLLWLFWQTASKTVACIFYHKTSRWQN